MRSGVLALAALVVAAAGCGDGAAAPPLPGTRLAAGRDFVGAFFWQPRVLAYTRLAASGNPDRQDLWVDDLDGAGARVALADVDWTPPSWWPSMRVGELLVTGSSELHVYDVARAVADDPPPGFTSVAVRPDGQQLAIYGNGFLMDASGTGAARTSRIRFGPLGAQREIDDLVTRGVDYLGPDLAIWGTAPGDTTAMLYRVSGAEGTLTALAPLPDAPAARDLVANSCLGVGQPGCGLFKVLGCADDSPPCAGTGARPCAIVFVREADDADGNATLTPFALDVAAGTETALGGQIDSTGFSRSPDREVVAWRDPSTAGENTVVVWDACTQLPLRCAFPPTTAGGPDMSYLFTSWRPDSGAVASLSVAGSSQLLVTTRADAACVAPAEGAAAQSVFFSHAGDLMGWSTHDGDTNTDALWIADGNGRAPRQVAAGDVFSGRFSRDGRFLIVQHYGETLALGAIDLSAPALLERPLAGAVGGYALGSRRLLAMTSWNTQDLSGRLELFDLVAGTSTVLANPVIDFAPAGSVDDAVEVGYLAHTRFPTDRDGLWLTTLPAADPP
jgi:hypothetical protein